MCKLVCGLCSAFTSLSLLRNDEVTLGLNSLTGRLPLWEVLAVTITGCPEREVLVVMRGVRQFVLRLLRYALRGIIACRAQWLRYAPKLPEGPCPRTFWGAR